MTYRCRVCPFTGCGARIPSGMFACGSHWRKIPEELQKDCYFVYGQYQEGTISVKDLRTYQETLVHVLEAGGPTLLEEDGPVRDISKEG